MPGYRRRYYQVCFGLPIQSQKQSQRGSGSAADLEELVSEWSGGGSGGGGGGGISDGRASVAAAAAALPNA